MVIKLPENLVYDIPCRVRKSRIGWRENDNGLAGAIGGPRADLQTQFVGRGSRLDCEA
jgi:hypothetical protein